MHYIRHAIIIYNMHLKNIIYKMYLRSMKYLCYIIIEIVMHIAIILITNLSIDYVNKKTCNTII